MEDRKTQIINTAIDFIKEYGFDSFSYKDLSETVGITKASLHHHFPKKEDLGLAVCKVLYQDIEESKLKTDPMNSAKEKMEFIFTHFIDSDKRKSICPVSSLQAEYNVIPNSMKEAVNKICDLEINYISQTLKEGLNDGSFEFKGDIKSMAFLILSSSKGALQYSRVSETFIFEDILKQIYRQILR